MFDAYKIAIKIQLVNHVSAGLAALSKQFNVASGDAARLQHHLTIIGKWGMLGGAAGAAGFAGLGLIGKALNAGKEYAHQLNVMNIAGMKQVEIATAAGDAWSLHTLL